MLKRRRKKRKSILLAVAKSEKKLIQGIIFLFFFSLIIVFIFGDHGIYKLYKIKKGICPSCSIRTKNKYYHNSEVLDPA